MSIASLELVYLIHELCGYGIAAGADRQRQQGFVGMQAWVGTL